ncbi:calpain-10 isoform X1 [Anas platyrhynchos]|uniref:Calpain-10 n=3 Tax=Anas TaxID=8835 RepID=A0A493TTR5_ANAPP|nr:calpain-10 isoform X1 [Anas platyrhynchos]|eukprot:XP_027319996.1 calpain-10 isoform X1 [Anas platyrhynchos]
MLGEKKQLTVKRDLYADPTFPASDASIFFNYCTPLAQFRGEISWLRPQDICSTPRLFSNNLQDVQVKQGILGDCWFLCACVALQKSKYLLNKVIPPGQPSWTDESYRGCFTCRVWQFGHWVEVTIDDRLPCLGGKLCFSQCQTEDLFWLPLLEKAYAKVHGSYEQLWAGQVADALVDLTGGIAERWTLKDPGRNVEKEKTGMVLKKELFRRLMNLKEQCVISCSVLNSRQGASELGEFHAFIVIDMLNLSEVSGKEIVLLRIRNPWGRRCWKGPWCEGGQGWSQLDPVVASELLSQIQEGEFWVDEEEFFREFDEITMGFPINEEGQLQSLYTEKVLYHSQNLFGSWVRGQSAGGCRNNSSFPTNPKFWLRVCEKSEVCIALLQKHRKYSADWAGRIQNLTHLVEKNLSLTEGMQVKNYQAVGLHVWKVEKKRFNLPKTLSAPPVVGTICHSYDREVHVCCDLSPGYYLVVPSTFLKDAVGHFLLRVFSTGRISLSEVKPPPPDAALSEELPAGEWETVQLQGCWKNGQSAGGSRNFPSFHINPCFPLSIPAGPGKSSVKVTLRQHCQDSKCRPIGFHIFQVPNSSWKPNTSSFLHLEPLVSCVPHCYSQEVSQLCRLPAGSYVIIPSTYLPNTEGNFTVVIATKIDRKRIHSRETLGQVLQEVSFTTVMKK